jgi:hypothetical protein
MTILILVLFFLLIFFVYYCIKFALIVLNIQDKLENSLTKIDEKYIRINEILEIPLFFDSPEIRRLLFEIEETRDIILDISYELSNIDKPKKEYSDLEDHKEKM